MNERRQPDVGTRLVALRKERGLSLRALARKCGLSVNAISRIERRESSPTVSSLQQLATALDVTLTEFFRIEPEHSVVVVRKDRRLRTRGDGVLMESLGTGLYGQHLGPFLMTLMPGASAGEEPLSHGGEEFVHCMEGQVDYMVGEEWYRLNAGDSLLFIASQEHMCSNTGLEKARLLLVIQAPEEEIGTTQQRHLMTETS
ncbi:helix-turn-helix domain-containing protein [Gemmatimonadota bacterium]